MAIASHMSPDETPSLSDTILAMDIADTIRHDDRLKEAELSDADRRKALKERLRQAYAAQGDVVSDEILERAISRMNEDRFVHSSNGVSPASAFWNAYVNRGRIGRNVAMATTAAVVIVAGFKVGHYALIEAPRLRAEQALADQLDIALPQRLESSFTYTSGIADRLNDQEAKDRIVAIHDQAKADLKLRNADAATKNIMQIEALGGELKRREDRDKLVALVPEITKGPITEAADTATRDALGALASQVEAAAMRGDAVAFTKQKARFDDLWDYVRTPYTIKVVSRTGVKSGVERMHDQSGSKTWYLIVEAVNAAGDAHPLEIKDRLLGTTETVKTWGIQVPRSTYLELKADKADGVLDNDVAGEKPAGTIKITWSMNVFDGQTINEWGN